MAKRTDKSKALRKTVKQQAKKIEELSRRLKKIEEERPRRWSATIDGTETYEKE